MDNKKITFEDKVDSQVLSSYQNDILTANNLNEIKNVVNALSDQIDNVTSFNDVFRYIKINVPEIAVGKKYSIQVQLCPNPMFNDTITLINSNPNNYQQRIQSASGNFYIFEQNVWKQCQNMVINQNDCDKVLKFDIKQKLTNNFPYFGRLRFKEINTNNYSKYFGFSLSYINVQDPIFLTQNNLYDSFQISGDVSVKSNQQHIYQLFGILKNGSKINLTSAATFQCLSSNVSYMEENILYTDLIKNDQIQIIKATFIADQVLQTAKFQVYLNRTDDKILTYFIECNSSLEPGKVTPINIKTRSANDLIKDVTQNSIITITPSSVCSIQNLYTSQSALIVLSANINIPYQQIAIIQAKYPKTQPYFITQKQVKINGNSNYQLSAKFTNQYVESKSVTTSSFNTLINFGYIDDQFFNLVKFNVVKKDVKSDSYVDVTNDVTIKEIDSDYLIISKDNSLNLWKIELDTLKYSYLTRDVNLLISIVQNQTGNQKKYYVKISVKDELRNKQYSSMQIDVISGNIIPSNKTYDYFINGVKFINGEKFLENITKLCNITLFTPNNQAFMNEIESKIISNKIKENSFGYIKAVYPQSDGSNLTSYYELVFVKDQNEEN